MRKRTTFKSVLDFLLDHFDLDKDKAMAFYLTPLKHFNHKTPYEMVKDGKAQTLINFLQQTGSTNETFTDRRKN